MYPISERLIDLTMFGHLCLENNYPPEPSDIQKINYSLLVEDRFVYTQSGPTLDGDLYTLKIPMTELLMVSKGDVAYPPRSTEYPENIFFNRFGWLLRLCIYDFARLRQIYFGPNPTPSSLEHQELVVSMTPPESEFPCLTVNESSYFLLPSFSS